jgi:hypothetical protein
MSKKQRVYLEDPKVDHQIIRLFPNLDYTASNIASNTVEIRKKYLFALAKAADEGFVTSYGLKKEKWGVESVLNVFNRLVAWGFLREQKAVGQKNTERKDGFLTVKGVIAE